MASGASAEEIATVTAKSVDICKDAALFVSKQDASVALSQDDAVALDLADVLILNTAVGGEFHTNNLTLEWGSTLALDKAHVDLNNGSLTLKEWGAEKIHLELTPDGELMADSTVLLFSGVSTLTMGSYGDMTEYKEPFSFNAQDYFTGSMIGEKTQVVFQGNKVTMSGLIPEPSAFGLCAGLGALALVGMRRRRRK